MTLLATPTAHPQDAELRDAIVKATALAYLQEPDEDGIVPSVRVTLDDGTMIVGFVVVLDHVTTVRYTIIPAGA